MTFHLTRAHDMHPYECWLPDSPCPHCERRDDETHDPGICALCDPGYDMQPNPYWNRRRRRREKAWAVEET